VIDVEEFHLSTYKIASKKVRKGAFFIFNLSPLMLFSSLLARGASAAS
jgi:hypothetical protein